MPRLWLPKSARARVEENRKVYACAQCGQMLGEFRQYVQHVAACSKKHEVEILELTDAKERSAFTSVLDKEQHRWQREVAAGIRNPKSRGVIVDPVKSA
jgi:hypothetical protein